MTDTLKKKNWMGFISGIYLLPCGALLTSFGLTIVWAVPKNFHDGSLFLGLLYSILGFIVVGGGIHTLRRAR